MSNGRAGGRPAEGSRGGGAARVVLTGTQWRQRERLHREAVEALTADHRARAQAHDSHPVHDFLFTYYSLRPAQLARWHPGIGVALTDPGERITWRFAAQLPGPPNPDSSRENGPGDREVVVTVDAAAFLQRRGTLVAFVERLMANTASAAGQFGCFGLHEWAMVYRMPAEDLRHAGRSLRLGAAGTDAVVEQHQLRCSHHDAVRFFTPDARGRNLLAPDLDSRDRMEQPGCLHATMDLYKWAYKLLPVVSSDLLLDCHLLARDVRELDMRAAPYDLRDLGYEPVPIETAAGKSTYVAAQRGFAERGQLLRRRLLDVIGQVRQAAPDQLPDPSEALRCQPTTSPA